MVKTHVVILHYCGHFTYCIGFIHVEHPENGQLKFQGIGWRILAKINSIPTNYSDVAEHRTLITSNYLGLIYSPVNDDCLKSN